MFTEKIVQTIWEKARIVEGYDSDSIRKDACGAWIIREHYGMLDSDYGWVIDHVYPLILGGGDDQVNLRAMQWENEASKGGDYPVYKSVVIAEGNKNIHVEGQYTINQSLQEQLRTLYH